MKRNFSSGILLSILLTLCAGTLFAAPEADKGIDDTWMRELHGGAQTGDSAAGVTEEKKQAGKITETKEGSGIFDPATEGDRGGDLFTSGRAEEPPSFFETVLRFVLLMGAMTALLYLVLRYMKSRSGTLGSGSELVEVIASIPILQNKYIQIVDLAGKLLVIGVSENGIHLIHTVEDARTADRIRLYQSHRREAPASGLLTDLKKFLKREGFLDHKESADDGKQNRDEFSSILARETGLLELKTESEEEQIDYMKGLLKRQRTKIERLKKE